MHTHFCAFPILFVLAAPVVAEPVVRLQDVICVPGQKSVLTAQVATDISLSLKAGKSNVPVEFIVDGRVLGRAITNSKGTAELQVDAGRVSGESYRARVLYKGRELTGQGRWFNWRTDRTIVAVDIDDTVCKTNYADLFLSTYDRVSPPLDGAAAALNNISRRFHVLYFSARPLWLTDKTREWLKDHGFPAGPVVHKGSWDSCLRQQAAKESLLAELRPKLPNLLIGIADRQVDVNAFGSHGMITMLVRNAKLARSGTRAVGFGGWSELDRYLSQHDVLADAGVLGQAVADNSYPPTIPQELTTASDQRLSDAARQRTAQVDSNAVVVR